MCAGVKSQSERIHVDKSYGHQSGPPPRCCMPQSVVPLIIRGRHPNRAAHTAPIYPRWPIHTADILFRGAARLVIGGGHTAQTLTRATLEPLSRPSTSGSHTGLVPTTRTLFRHFKCSCVRTREHRRGPTPGFSANTAAARPEDHPLHLPLRHYAHVPKITAWDVCMQINKPQL